MAVSLSDVPDHQLLLGLHPEVPAELTVPAQEVGGQQDGGGEAALSRHSVDLLQVSFGRLVPQEEDSQSKELKYQEILSQVSRVVGCRTLQTAHWNASPW